MSISSASILVLLSKAPAAACAFWRLSLSAVLTFLAYLVLRLRGKGEDLVVSLSNRRTLLMVLGAGLSLAAHFVLWMQSLLLVPVAISTAVVVTYPLFSAFVEWVSGSEKPRLIQVVGLVGGFAGVSYYLLKGFLGFANLTGVLLALAGALTATSYFRLGKILRRDLSVVEYTLPTYLLAGLFVAAYSFLAGVELIRYPPVTYTYFTLLAVIPMLGGHTLMNYALKYMKASTVTSVALLEPVGASILAAVILNQSVGVDVALVVAVIVTSLYLVIRYEEGL